MPTWRSHPLKFTNGDCISGIGSLPCSFLGTTLIPKQFSQGGQTNQFPRVTGFDFDSVSRLPSRQ
ncbi:hypothetical protein SANTM175S_04434 [Streptomyces antimycoticus]